MLLGEIAELNGSPAIPTGTVGAVVGATLQPSTFALSQLGGVILAPGLGAQGAGPADIAARFAGCRPDGAAEQLAGDFERGSRSRRPASSALSLYRELAAAMG